MKRKKRNKFSIRLNPAPYREISIKGTQVSAEEGGVIPIRHISNFNPYDGLIPSEQQDQ